MNTKNKIMLVSIIASVIVIMGIMIYLIYDIATSPAEEPSTTETTSEVKTTENPDFDTTEGTSQGNTYVPPTFEYIEDTHNYVFVGDSRYVAMKPLKGENDTFVCENGVGRFFLIENMDKIISLASDGNTRIVIGLGVNDINSPEEYITLLKDLRQRTDAEIFYVLVNPVDEGLCRGSGYSITNKAIDNFNVQVSDGIMDEDINIIDVNSFLKDAGFSCTDGLHYTDETYGTIFHYLKTSLSHY